MAACLANMSAAELRAAAEAAEAAERARQEQQGAPDFRETAARVEQKLEQAVSLLSTQAEKIDRLEASLKASAQEIDASSLNVARQVVAIGVVAGDLVQRLDALTERVEAGETAVVGRVDEAMDAMERRVEGCVAAMEAACAGGAPRRGGRQHCSLPDATSGVQSLTASRQ